MTLPLSRVSHTELVEFVASWDATELGANINEPSEAFLIGQTVQRPRQAVQRRRECIERIGKRRPNQMHGMGRDIPRLL